MIVLYRVVSMPVNRGSKVFLEPVRMSVFCDERRMLLNSFQNGRHMGRDWHGSP